MHYHVSYKKRSKDCGWVFWCISLLLTRTSKQAGRRMRWMWVQQINQFNTQRSRLTPTSSMSRNLLFSFLTITASSSSPSRLSSSCQECLWLLAGWQVLFPIPTSPPLVNWRLLTPFPRFPVELQVQTLNCVSNGIVAPQKPYTLHHHPASSPEELHS